MYGVFNIVNKDVICVVGSGGKTTLINGLSKELKLKGKVLSTTTTKIKVPTLFEEDEIYIADYKDVKNIMKNLIITGNGIKNGKVDSLNEENLNEIIDDFNYTLIEADGSKMLPYKAWRDLEPVIPIKTTKTIGVLPIKYLYKNIPKEEIFNFEKFVCDFKSVYLNHELINNIINHKEGLFKNATGEKILFINTKDTKIDKKLLEELKLIDKNNIDKIIYGSREEGYYES